MRLRQTIVAAAVATVLLCAVASLTVGQNVRTENASPLAFKGEVAVLFLKSDPRTGIALEKPELKQIGKSEFLVGTAVSPKNWTDGKLVWIPVDAIGMTTEFKDAESYRNQGDNRQ